MNKYRKLQKKGRRGKVMEYTGHAEHSGKTIFFKLYGLWVPKDAEFCIGF
jgi:hypothetical protein